ncbi:hypothetical protein PO909_004496, partial [Leuciscus waleckii]
VKGVSLILGNDLAGKKVFCLPEVIDVPNVNEEDVLKNEFPDVFGTCVVTQAQARKFKETVDLSNSFMCADDFAQTEKEAEAVEIDVCALPNIDLSFVTVDPSVLSEYPVAYYLEDGVLMRKWTPSHRDNDWSTVFQVVVPKPYREQVMSVAHDHELSGHVGIRKTYDYLLKHFFWPLMKLDVAKFCKSCHACQMGGKPNQVIPPAQLKPIPVLGEPFERILIDCIGPLPRTKSGNTYLLMLICALSRFPEAIPLRSLKAPTIVKAIVKFCTTFGMPKYIHTV